MTNEDLRMQCHGTLIFQNKNKHTTDTYKLCMQCQSFYTQSQQIFWKYVVFIVQQNKCKQFI